MDSVLTDARQLKSIDELGLVEQNSVQISCQRSIAGGAFSAGSQDFNFSISGTQRWSPSRSYFKARIKVTTDGATQPTQGHQLALAENFMNNMYNNAYCYIGNTDISSISQYIGQVATVKSRLSRSKGWFDSVGKTGYGWNADINERIQDISIDGSTKPNQSYRTSPVLLGFNALDTAALDYASGVVTIAPGGGVAVPDVRQIFQVGDVFHMSAALPAVGGAPAGVPLIIISLLTATTFQTIGGDADIVATPDFHLGSRKSAAYSVTAKHNQIEICWVPPLGIFSTESALPSGTYKISLMPKTTTGTEGLESVVGRAGRIEVQEIFFMMSIFRDEKSMDSSTYYLSLDEVNVQSKALTNGAGQNSLNFTVPASTFGIATFSQGVAAGTTTRIPPSKFHGLNLDSTLGLNNIQLTYSNISKPLQNTNSSYLGPQNYLAARYLESMTNADLYNLSCETFEDWAIRGPLLYFSWVKSADDRSTELQYSSVYNNMEVNANCFVCSFYRNLIKIEVQNGFISSVEKIAM
jgi:hypothetical protein